MISNEETLDYFELHICIKDYCFARDDRLVGVAVIQIKDIVEQVLFIFVLKDHTIHNIYNHFVSGIYRKVASTRKEDSNGWNRMDNLTNPISTK